MSINLIKMVRIILSLFLLSLFSTWSDMADDLVIKGKHLKIKGKTSIGKFDCDYEINGENDTISMQVSDQRDVPVLDFTIPVESFACGNRMLEKDFCKTLKADDYPHIRVRVENFIKRDDAFFGDVVINLVGGELRMNEIGFELLEEKESTILNTEVNIELSHFKLQPPKRFFGIIKVHDILLVDVSLLL